ncbi:HAD family hydrolase [Pseudonocardia kunmingensis]|uniref:HAD superfamily hydrolase (TIGR01509 family) n=1 Tax=Pseudonocardia kunmingensis TaxID=630975 RepID=A0A543DKY0_9PSEU|nr:HAD family phosphatase [Pseudonocardia kunmingensis]TQM09997.1 HAD superfamily hydrolase (TIGR01509 family) [Pseudonocardia kunmingensis]
MPVARAPSAVLWDLDGTIVDTEPHFLRSVASIVARAGGALDEGDRRELVGANLWDMAATAIRAGARGSAAEIVEEIVESVTRRVRDGVEWRPGALELLGGVRAAGIPTALVTGSFRRIAEVVVGGIPFVAFDAVVTGEDVVRGKPDPQPYLRAAALLGVDIRGCLVIEDSVAGVRSGVAAGAAVVAVPGAVDVPAVQGCTTWHSLAGKDLSSLVAAWRAPDRLPGRTSDRTRPTSA